MTEAVKPVEVDSSTVMAKTAKSRKARSKQTASEKWRHLEESRAKIRERLIFVNRFENVHLDRHQKKLENKEEKSLRNIFETKDKMKFSLIDLSKSKRHYKTKVCDYERRLRKGMLSPVFSKERERCRQKERDLRELRSRLEGPNSSVVAEHLKDELKMIEFRSLIGGADLNASKALPGIGNKQGHDHRRASQTFTSFASLQMNNQPQEYHQRPAYFAKSLQEISSSSNSMKSHVNPLTKPHQNLPRDLKLKHTAQIVDISPPTLQQISSKRQSQEEVPCKSSTENNDEKFENDETISKRNLDESNRKENCRKQRKIFNKHSRDIAVSSDLKSDVKTDSLSSMSENQRLSPVVENSDAEEECEKDDLKDKDAVDTVLEESNHERLTPIHEDNEPLKESDEKIYDYNTSSSIDTSTDTQASPIKRLKKIKLLSKMKRKLLKDNDTVTKIPAEVARAERHAKKRLAEVKMKTDDHLDKLKTQNNNKGSPQFELDEDFDYVMKANRLQSAASSGYNPNIRKHSRTLESKTDSSGDKGGIRLPPIRVDVKLLKELKRQRAKHLEESVGLPTLP